MRDMSNGDCKRCAGDGMAGYKHRAGGVCFLCGRMPAGEGQTARADTLCSKRERCILDLAAYLNNAKREHAAGDLTDWLSDSAGYGDPTTLESIRGLVTVAPSDVAARARAAFARLGVAA
jgi:hypothetical protein